MIDGERYLDPLWDVLDYQEYDIRMGHMNGTGRTRDTERYTRKALVTHGNRPVIDRQGADIREPSLDEGASFVQPCGRGDDYV